VNSLPTQLTPDLPFDVVGGRLATKTPAAKRNLCPSPPITSTPCAFRSSQDAPSVSLTRSGSEPVVIINQQVAGAYFKGQNPIGQHIRIGAIMGLEDGVREIVGVVGDTKSSGLDAPSPGIMYLPGAQTPDSITRGGVGQRGVSWVVRSKAGKVDVAAAARGSSWRVRAHRCSVWRRCRT
jgi:hypothetical protein